MPPPLHTQCQHFSRRCCLCRRVLANYKPQSPPQIKVTKPSRKRHRPKHEDEYEGYASEDYFGPRSEDEDEDLARYSRYIHESCDD